MTRFIGDIHGKIEAYQALINDGPSIQLGDFGHGFVSVPELPAEARHIRGNHDDPAKCRDNPNWIPDGSYFDEMFFVGGAKSVDAYKRIPGVDWWHDEELTYMELNHMVDLYDQYRPRIMVSHDCPQDIYPFLPNIALSNAADQSATRQAFDAMLSIHSPEVWLHGHYHVDFEVTFQGTRFICLAELSYIDL